MAAKRWTHVRLTAGTCEQLAAVKAILERSHERGQRAIPFGPKGEITADYVVSTLAAHFLAHNQRSKK